jgi:arsenite methyltransferase
MHLLDPQHLLGYDTHSVALLAARVAALYESIQPPGAGPMLDFDERDLVHLAEAAGFADIDLKLRVSVKSAKEPVPWQRFLRMPANPQILALGEALKRVLTPGEVAGFTGWLRPLVESGTGQDRSALAYLTATKGEPR